MATKITNKQVKVISNVNFNNKEIENAIIDATKNNITNVEEIIKVDDVLVNGTSVVEDKIANVNVPINTSDLNNDSGYITNAVDNLMNYPTTTTVQAADTELQEQINQLQSRGRFLSLWDCITGLAESEPTVAPYEYKTGDYFIVGNIGITNYRPFGSSYTPTEPSTVIETGDVQINDTYVYDGNNWLLQENHNKEMGFSEIVGSPYDNTALGNALNSKQNTLVSGTNIKTINGESILGTGDLEIKSGSELNEFVITQEIFDEYKNENDYADLADIIDSEEITQKVINLNNFNFFLNSLTISNKDLIFKNGNIILDSNGVDGTCDKAITASGCNIEFKDCQISSVNCIGNINALIDINNTNLTFNNVIADDINFSVTKSFIQTTNACNIKIDDSDIELKNNEEITGNNDEPQNIITFIKVLNDNSNIKINNSIIKINKTDNQLRYFQHKMISTATNVDVGIKINNSYLEIEDNWDLPHTLKEHELSNIFDVNLDNTDIDIINSCINNQSLLRLESKYMFQQGNTYTTDDPYCINIYNDIETRGHYTEDEEHIFEEINIDKDTFLSIVDYQEGEYIFIYDGTNWILNDETVNPEDYGITYTLIDGAELYDGVEIQVYYDKRYEAYDILKDFTANDDIENYTKIIKDTIIDDTVPGIEFIRVENEEDYINTINDILEENDYPTDDTYYEEYTYNNDEWHLKLYRIVSETEDVVIENEVVDLNEFGGAIQIGLNDETPDLVNGMKFTVVSQTPYLEKRGLHINKCYNSVIAQDTVPGYKFSEYFINNHTIGETSVFSVHKVMSESISTDEISADSLSINEEGDYFLPIHNENLESNNVKDAINELADREISTNNLFDIKTILTADAEANKGWACTCYDEPHKLNENQVAGAYHEIENMLNQTVETKIELTNKTDVNMNVRNMFYGGGFYYFVIGNGTNAVVKRSDNVDGETLEDVVNVGEELNPENDYSLVVCNCIERDNEIYFMFYFADTSFGDDYTLLYDKDWNLVVKYISDASIMPYIFGSNAVFGKNEYSNKIFIPSVVYDYNDPEGSIASVRLIIYDIDSGNYEVILKSLSDSSFNYMSTQTSFYDNKIWISTSSQVISIDLDNNYNIFINTELIPSNSTGFITGMTYVKSSIIDEEETIDTLYFIYSDTTNENSFFKILRYNDDNVWEEVYYDEGYTNEYNYVTDVKNYNEKTIISTGNNIYISRNLNDIESLYQINNAGDLIINDNILSVKGTVNSDGYSYFDIEENKIEFTDTYNINGEDVDINYYKSGEYKICEAGQNNRDDSDSNEEMDSKLQDVYEYLGYLPYFWIDTENLDIVLPRNSNRWTMMYVGDDYIDGSLPSGNYLPFATKPIKLTNITASNWIEDDTFEDYGYKCEIECEGINENMFAQVVFSIEEANSGNYASVCDTAENKVIIYSKVNDTITIPTIVIMEA